MSTIFRQFQHAVLQKHKRSQKAKLMGQGPDRRPQWQIVHSGSKQTR